MTNIRKCQMILFCIIHNALKRKICIDLINRKKTRLPRGQGRVVCGTVYGDMHLKDLLRSIVRVGYRIPVPDFCLVLHGLRCQKKHYNGLNQLNQNRLSKPLKYTFIGIVKLSNIFSL